MRIYILFSHAKAFRHRAARRWAETRVLPWPALVRTSWVIVIFGETEGVRPDAVSTVSP